jgi:hypothetical protein
MFSTEDLYRSSGPDLRAAAIVGISKLDKNSPIKVDLDVAKVLAQLDLEPLREFQHINTSSFETIPNQKQEYINARTRLETLLKKNPEAAQSAVTAFKSMSNADYRRTMSSLASNMNDDTAFAQLIVKKLEAKPETIGEELQKFHAAITDKKDDLAVEKYIAANGGKKLQVAQSASPPAPVRPDAGKPQNGKPPTVAAPVLAPAANAPAPASGGGASNDLTGDEAVAKYDALINHPDPARRALAKLIRDKGLHDKTRDALKEDPKSYARFNDPAARKDMMSALESGNTAAFLLAMGGPKLGAPPEINVGDMAGIGKIGETLKGALNLVTGTFGTFMKGGQEFGDIVSRLADGFGDKTVAMLNEQKRLLERFINSPDVKDRTFAAQVISNAAAGMKSGVPNLEMYSTKFLEKAPMDPETMKKIKDGEVAYGFVAVGFKPGPKGDVLYGEPKQYADVGEWARDKVQQVTTPNLDILSPEERRQRMDAVPPGEVFPAGLQPSGAVTHPVLPQSI